MHCRTPKLSIDLNRCRATYLKTVTLIKLERENYTHDFKLIFQQLFFFSPQIHINEYLPLLQR